MKTQTVAFRKSGRVASVHPVGDDSPSACGSPSVEFGSCSDNATTLACQVRTVSIDSNGCASLSGVVGNGLAAFSIRIDASGNTASAVAGSDRFTLFRISR